MSGRALVRNKGGVINDHLKGTHVHLEASNQAMNLLGVPLNRTENLSQNRYKIDDDKPCLILWGGALGSFVCVKMMLDWTMRPRWIDR